MSSESPATTESSSGTSEVALGVGIVLGALALGVLVALAVCIMRRRRRRNGEQVNADGDVAPRHLTRLERIALPETGADPNNIRQLRQRRWTSRHGNNGLTADELDLVAPVRDFQPGRKRGGAGSDACDALSATTATSVSASDDGGAPENSTPAVDDATDDTCAVCLDDMVLGDKTRVLRCNHEFHDECISAWVSKANRCPVCNVEPLEAAAVAKRRNARSSARRGIDSGISRERRRRTRSPGGFYHLDSEGGHVSVPVEPPADDNIDGAPPQREILNGAAAHGTGSGPGRLSSHSSRQGLVPPPPAAIAGLPVTNV